MRQILKVKQTSKSCEIRRVAMISTHTSLLPVSEIILKSGVNCSSRAQFQRVDFGDNEVRAGDFIVVSYNIEQSSRNFTKPRHVISE